MNLSEFCQPFYAASKTACGIKGKTAQGTISEFFMAAALNSRAKIELVFAIDTFRKWFRGDRSPSPELWNTVSTVFDEVFFSRTISANMNEKVLDDLIRKFNIDLSEGDVVDKYAFSGALTKQFKAIADGGGEAEDIVDQAYKNYLATVEFPAYLENSKNKYSKLKTLLYSSQERPFYEFFVCNTISTRPRHFLGHSRNLPEGMIIENVTLDKLDTKFHCALLVGMGGIGKSMMLRHLFLQSVEQFQRTGILPIIVTLREFGAENNDVFNLIVDSVHRFDISFSAAHVHKLLEEGKCQVLLDGLDEIKASDLREFETQLDALMDRYPANQFVMSTRKFDEFIGLSRFTMLWMMPFSHNQALELIDKLEFCPEEPRLKQKFRDQLESDLFKSHAEFVTNPLLLTLMLMNYHRFAEVPEKKYLFYKQAYDTLLYRHDADKLAYKRVFRSVTDPSTFTDVFREFCGKSYRRGDYEFDLAKFEGYFAKLKSVERLDSPQMTTENFLFDVCNSACLMYEESRSYHFLHRSFQEYFFADYYSRQNDDVLRKLGKAMDKAHRSYFDDSPAFDMLYDLAPEKVEQFIIFPYLQEICEQSDRDRGYWLFLKTGYGRYSYTIMDKEKLAAYGVVNYFPVFGNFLMPSSEILSLIYRILKMDEGFDVPTKGKTLDYPELKDGILYLDKDFKKNENSATMRAPLRLLEEQEDLRKIHVYERIALDKDDKPIEFGYTYSFDFGLALNEEERKKYPEIIKIWKNSTCKGQKYYRRLKSYYDALSAKYNKVLDDDDF